MTQQVQPQVPRPKPFFETTLGALAIVAAVLGVILVVAYLGHVNSTEDDSVTVVCNGDASSTTCTRY